MSAMSVAFDAAVSAQSQKNAPRAEEENGLLTLYHDQWPVSIDSDYDDFIRFFGYNPEHWTVVEPGTMSKWQQSKGNDDGSRDVVWLYSYKGVKFRKKTSADFLSEEQLDQIVKSVRKSWKPLTRKTLGMGLGAPEAYVHAQGDEQTGKKEGGGIAGLEERELQGLERSLAYVKQLMKQGVNIEAIADVSTGDRVENIFGHYPSQGRTTATLRKQQEYAVRADVRRIKAFAELGLPVIIPRTPSNHGELRQAIGQAPFTSESDNLDLIIAEMAKMILDETAIADQLEWHIPHDEYLTTFDILGVNCGVTHGHKIKGSGTQAVAKWVKDQRDFLSFHEDYKLKLLWMGHFHHYYAEELNGTMVIMTPSLDGGSPWFQASSGQRATPGLLGMTVSSAHPMGFSHLSSL